MTLGDWVPFRAVICFLGSSRQQGQIPRRGFDYSKARPVR